MNEWMWQKRRTLKLPTPHRSREDTPEEMVILQLVKDALLEEESSIGLSIRD